MVTISLQDAGFTSEMDPVCGVPVSKRVTDRFFPAIPFVYAGGDGLKLATVDGQTLPSYADVITDVGQSPSSAWPALGITPIPIRHVAAILEVDALILSHYGNRRDILHSLINVKATAVFELWRKLSVIGGSVDPAEPNGVFAWAELYANTITANAGAGGTVLAGELESLLSLLAPQHGTSNVYLVMHSAALADLRANAYQRDISTIEHPRLGRLPLVAQTPVLISDHIPTNLGAGSDQTTIAAVVLEPFAGFFGVLPCAQRGREITVEGPSLQEATDTYAFHLRGPIGFGGTDKTVALLKNAQA